MSLRLEPLQRLAASMQTQGVWCQSFEHRYKRHVFDVFFATGIPAELLLGVRETRPPLAILFEVKDGGLLELRSKDCLERLLGLLTIRPDASGQSSFAAFVRGIELSIPLLALHSRVLQPRTIAAYRQVEEQSKMHFSGWHRHGSDGTRVADANLEKTRILLGWQAFEFCQRGNVSSCWTDDPLSSVPVDLGMLRSRSI